MLAAMLLVKASHRLVMLRDIPSGALSILRRLLFSRAETAATFAHRLHQCLVCLIFAEVVAPGAVELGRGEHLAPVGPPQVCSPHIRRVVIHFAQFYRLLLLWRALFGDPLVSLLLVLPREVAADSDWRLLVNVNIYRSSSFELAWRYLVQRLVEMVRRLGLNLVRIYQGLHHAMVAIHGALGHVESAVAQDVVLSTAVSEDVAFVAAVDLVRPG